ncbi:GspH/FimT family pseudopilin [Stenotrophomonas sp. 22385]|uniref:GspH/FimT family pseudopilin n=1 Tax=Stenotrophomonas sp. 22385 TaxID=3453915 RepID=UPI003F86D3AD
MYRPARPVRPRGWTLLELVSALVIVGVLCAIALPSLASGLSRLRADMLRMQLVSVFNSARSTAITRHAAVAVCPSEEGRQCGGDWSRGWLIHLDRGASTLSPAPEDVLQYRQGYHDTSVSARSSQERRRLRFQADGRSGGSPLTVAICARAQLQGEVVVNNVGRTRATRQRGSVACPH